MHLRTLHLYLGTIVLFLLPYFATAQLFINEFVSSNSAGIADPDYDETADWIEIYNHFDISIDLAGYYLTDNLSNKQKWELPDGTQIESKGYLLIWADGINEGLHTNFKLTKDGEEIGLSNAQGVLLDSIVYRHQKTDISYGRKSDGNSNWGYFEEPTPGASNNTASFEGIVFYKPKFSKRGGFYNQTIEVSLSAIDGQIRYTTDGSVPTLSSDLYTTTIELNASTILRASVFIFGQIPGSPATQSYFINEGLENRKLPVVSIATNPEYFWDPEIGLYVQDFKPEWEYPINIELFENDGGDRAAFNELAGTRVNGLNAWQLPQKMLGIYFDNEYDQNNLEYPLFFDRRRNKFDNFILRASGSDWSFTMFRDGLTQGLVSENMDLERTGFRPSIVFVNGYYMGIHNIRSRMDEGFIEENFGLSGSEYDLLENNGEIEQGDDVAFNELFNLLYSDLSNQNNYDAVASIMDVDNCIDFFVAEIWASNASYGHNLQLWKPKTADSKWRWIAQDFDRGFSGSHNNLLDYFTTDEPHDYNYVRTAFRNLLQNDGFKNAFISKMADHLFTTYHPQRVTKHIQKHKSNIEMEMPYHIERWLGATSNYGDAIPSFEFWENEVEKLKTFMHERPATLYDDFQDYFNISEHAVLGVINTTTKGGLTTINGQPIRDANQIGSYFKNNPFTLQATPAIGYNFQGWSTANLDVLIEKESFWKYRDTGTYPGINWTENDFNDATWNVGQSQMGYGDGDENTVVSFGGDPDNKYITTYFRKTFVVNNPDQYTGQLILQLLRDDGAIVYLNGNEILRSNISFTALNFNTPALEFAAGPSENLYHLFPVQVGQLLEGENVIAVEIRQSDPGSSDLSFDLELKAVQKSTGNIISTNASMEVNLDNDQIFITHFEQQSNCILPDTITQNTTLTIDCSPYQAQRSVLVNPNVSLEIEAGVEVLFPAEARLIVEGDLQVKGTSDLPVRFLPNENAGANTWGQIFLNNATDTSSLVWLEIKGASYGQHPVRENAALAAWNSILEINHLEIVNVEGNPILTRYSDVWLRNSQLHSKVTGDLINVKYGYGLIDNCDFRGNDQIDTDAIDYDEVTNGIIRNSKIYNFFGFNSDGVDLGEGSSNVYMENNFIHHITDKGISVGQNSTVYGINNTIVDCNLGYGVKDEGVAIIDQSTFYNNGYDVAAFEKNPGIGGGSIQVSNAVFSNTVFSPVLEDEVSDVQIRYSLSDTDSIIGENMLYDNPVFQNPTQNEFQLQSSSPAINAGMNIAGNMINLGTHSFLYDANPNILISEIHYHPLG